MTTDDLPSLADAEWLGHPATQALLAILDVDGEEARVVGGAVRNALLGEPVHEVDIATTAPPQTVTARAEAAGFKVVPTGIDHGTVTVVVDGTPFEVTTLREDVETFGRHATVRFGRDWTADAHRRDFTMNALSVDRTGRLFDPVDGYPDCRARRVRFVGRADSRVQEDYLRILRFFRFHAHYGEGPPDPDGFLASIRGRDGLRRLSAERIAQETRRLVTARRAGETLTLMSEAGIIEIVFAGIAYPGVLDRLAHLEAERGEGATPALRIAAAGTRLREDAERIAERLKLSKAETKTMRAAVDAAPHFPVAPGQPARALRYRLGRDAFHDGVRLAWAQSLDPSHAAPWPELFDLADRFTPPAFPLDGKTLIKAGVPSGPELGAALRRLEDIWIASDFRHDRSALLERLETTR
ncbi:CCA tRNA nucleotidyltransferase [Amorphus orientalis]|uniref:tRNA nucleotidyltransferase/poly(A) polymerase n=1 Tax=Amorphus orientalis TaxID=649198 RepID=A0AAE3VK74_9HYPH|nr:CCA tRNA nucleotidyltransferase [Amorphus orientalis]MDQ0313884.1 tRNA nucleotidyltransferase/poly(A) polymerase [Amorphus orientalis]